MLEISNVSISHVLDRCLLGKERYNRFLNSIVTWSESATDINLIIQLIYTPTRYTCFCTLVLNIVLVFTLSLDYLSPSIL